MFIHLDGFTRLGAATEWAYGVTYATRLVDAAPRSRPLSGACYQVASSRSSAQPDWSSRVPLSQWGLDRGIGHLRRFRLNA